MHTHGFRPLLLVALIPALCAGIVLEQGTEITQGIGLDPLQGGGGGVDVTAPQVSGLSCVPASATTAECDFDTTENATSQIDYAIVAPAGWVTFPASDASADNTHHDVSLTGLQEGAPYYYRARTQDAAGNLTVTAPLTFTTPDQTSPTLSSFMPTGVTTTTGSFSWDNSELADCQVECSDDGPGSGDGYELTSTLDNTDTLACAHTITSLSDNATYHCRGISSDSSSNTGVSAEVAITTDALPSGGSLTMGDLLTPESVAMIDANGDGTAESLRFQAYDDTIYQASKGWNEYDVTCSIAPCASGLDPYTDDPGMAGCSAVTTSAPLGIRCMIANASPQSALLFPDGTYSFPNGGAVMISRSDIKVRSQNPQGAILDTLNVGRSSAGGSCTQNEAGASVFSICSPNVYSGSTVRAWTGGYAKGTTTVTVPAHGFSVGDEIMLYMDTNTACDVFQKLAANGQAQQTFATHHYAVVTAVPSADTVTIDDPLRGPYGGPGCTGMSARKVFMQRNVGVEGFYIRHNSSISTGIGNDSCPTSSAKFPKVVVSHFKNVWLIGNRFERNCESWVRFDVGAWIVEGQGNFFDLLNPTLFFNTEGAWVKRGVRVNLHNNVFDRANVGTKNEAGSEGLSWSWNKCIKASGYRGDERCLIGGHGWWTRGLIAEGNDSEKSLELGDFWWGGNEGPRIFYRNRVSWNGNECDQTSQLFINTDAHCPTPTNCTSTVIGHPSFGYAVTSSVFILNSSYTIMPGPIASGSCPPLRAGSNRTFNNVTPANYMERNALRHPAGLVDIGTPILNDSNVVSSSPPPAWSGLAAPVSLQYSARPYWWPASPPAGVCQWGLTGIGALGDDFTGTLCKLPAECYWVDGNAACAPF